MKRFLSTIGISVLGLVGVAHAQPNSNDNQLPPNVANQRNSPPATEARAKELALRDGYTDVGPLTKGADGKWRGIAKRGDREMRITIDTTIGTDGKVSP